MDERESKSISGGRATAERELERRLKEFTQKILGESDGGVYEYLLSIGVEAERAGKIAGSYDGALTDEVKRALKAAIENCGDHSGHRSRLRAAAARDPELEAFGDVDILETLLSFIIPQRDTAPMAKALIKKFGSLMAVMRAPAAELKVPGMTEVAAELIPMLAVIALRDGRSEVRISSLRAASSFFGSVYLGGSDDRGYIAYLDAGYGLIAVEKAEDLDIDLRRVVGSVCKYAAKYVIIAQRDEAILPERFDLVKQAGALSEALELIGAKLLDCLVFNRYGYYTLSASRTGAPVKYLFVPVQAMFDAPELARAVVADEGV